MKAFRTIAIVAAVFAIALLAASGLGTRAGAWDFRTGFTLLRYAAYLGAAAAVLALAALLITRPRGGALAALVGAVVLGAITFGLPYSQQLAARSVPPIHDITTDTADPPLFVDVLPLRADAPNSADYGGDSLAMQQREAYPDLQPVQLSVGAAEAFARVRRAADAMGWELVSTDSAAGRLEATATTTWFGFKDDVVVRVRPAGAAGAVVDVRSVSRVGRSDVGANAARIRRYVSQLTGGA